MSPSLPAGYKPYPELRLCSNVLLGSLTPIRVGDFPVFLVGVAQVPLIWLAARVGPDSDKWGYIVEASKPAHPSIRVDLDLLAQTVRVVLAPSVVLLEARNVSTEVAEVGALDFRPLGMNVHGTAQGLNFGGTDFVGNTFKGGGALFQVGKLPSDTVKAPQDA